MEESSRQNPESFPTSFPSRKESSTSAAVSFTTAYGSSRQLLASIRPFYALQQLYTCTEFCVDHFRKLPSQLSIVFGQWSLIQLDPNEKKVSAFKIMMNPGYNRTSKLNDLALIEVGFVSFKMEIINSLYTFDLLKVSNEIEINGVYDFLTYDEADPSYTTGTIMGWGALTVSLSNLILLQLVLSLFLSTCLKWKDGRTAHNETPKSPASHRFRYDLHQLHRQRV